MDTECTKKERDAVRYIRASMIEHGKMPSVRNLMAALGYKSPRSAALIIENLVQKGILGKRPDGSLRLIKDLPSNLGNARTVKVPIVGFAACGLPMLAEENIEGMLSISTNLAKPGFKYFLLRASGDSMNEVGINDGDLLLVRQQPTAENGEIVVALIDDEATVKEFYINNTIVLKPRSTNKQHREIILERDFQIQGVVTTTIPNIGE